MEPELTQPEPSLEALREKVQQLTTLISLNTAVSANTDLHSVLRLVSLAARQAINAEASAILLVDPKTRELYFETAAGGKSQQVREIRVPLGQGIAGLVAEGGKPEIVNDPYHDPRFFHEADKRSGFLTRNLLCVPIRLKHPASTQTEQIVGVLEVVNKRVEGGFSKDDLYIIELVANQAAVTIENSRLLRSLRLALDKLHRLKGSVGEVSIQTRTILIVDDDPLHLKVVASFLTQHGFEVHCAPTGQEAIEFARRTDTDLCLCLLDMVMPDKDGLAVLTEVLRIQPHLPVFIVTSQPNKAEVSRALMKGASEVILKPLTPDYLLNRVLVKIEAAIR